MSFCVFNVMWWRELKKYSLGPKIDAIVELGTQINVECKMTKLPFVFYEKNLDVNLFLCENLLEWLVFCDWLVKVAFFVGQISNSKIAFILGQRE
jgi:hypothetical protein